ncbi:MAG TPA: endopeptidase La [Oscillatoriaceae cyanobacterium]
MPEAEHDPMSAIPEAMPILPLRGCVAYPGLLLPLALGPSTATQMLEEVAAGDGWVGLAALIDADVADPGFQDVYPIGAAARLQRMWRTSEGQLQMILQVETRIELLESVQDNPYLVARVVPAPMAEGDENEEMALMRQVTRRFQELFEVSPQFPPELIAAVMAGEESKELVFLLTSALSLSTEVRQELLAASSTREMLLLVLGHLQREVELAQIGASLQAQVSERIGQQNKEFFLREQMRLIQEQLEPAGDESPAIADLEKKLAAGLLPPEAEAEAKREMRRLKQLPPGSPETGMVQHYLEWLGRLPWGVTQGHTPDVAEARAILDGDHAGLEKPKERLIEYLAVRRLRDQRGLPIDDCRVREPVLCFVGPPGVGKTSLGRSIAKALGRPFVRVSLGGVHDEAAIRGHRRTYVGAMPGRIVQALARAGSADPVIMLDELDKVGADYRGDPAAALLELLDPEQNHAFRDHFLDVPFDLSRAVFIATANTLDTVPPALHDRLEIIPLSGYTDDEKVAIAQQFLMARQLRINGLAANEMALEEASLRTVIAEYTREAGVRELERCIGALCRKSAIAIAEGKGPLEYGPDDVRNLLGKARFDAQNAEQIDRPGIATGLVWTPVGGDILFVEAAAMPGRKVLKLTGQLGEVMRESAEAALSFLRSRAEKLGLNPRFFEELDLHLHVPGGAVPKDGPSAGVTLSVAILSALTGRLVRDDVAMTGEITLRGKVLPVGGIKEKVLGARRAGIKTIVLPRRNLADLDELPEAVRAGMRFVPVDAVEEVWDVAFRDTSAIAEPEGLFEAQPRVWICRSPLPYGTVKGGKDERKGKPPRVTSVAWEGNGRSRIDADQS